MRSRLLAGLISMLLACGSSPPRVVPAEPRAAALDVAGFEPPFEQIPVARSFIARHRITKISIHELEPDTAMARSSEITEYDADGAPVRRYTRSGHEAPMLVEHIAYTHDDVPLATPPATLATPATPATPEVIEKVVVLDRAKRIAKVRMQRGSASMIETYTYDAAGNLVRVARESRGESAVEHHEELRTYAGGRLVKRTRGKVSAAPFETLELSYDAQGRFTEWRGAKPGFGDDRYFFTYDPSGQLASMRFQEGPKPIYRRDYTYDADGFLTHIELRSSVPAMNDASYALAYELANGEQRQAVDVSVPAPPKQKTDADVLAALRRVFPSASGGTVQWGDAGGRRLLETVTFQVPAAQLESATDEQLKEKACALRNALGYDECACERLERGSTRAGVTVVTFHLMLGC